MHCRQSDACECGTLSFIKDFHRLCSCAQAESTLQVDVVDNAPYHFTFCFCCCCCCCCCCCWNCIFMSALQYTRTNKTDNFDPKLKIHWKRKYCQASSRTSMCLLRYPRCCRSRRVMTSGASCGSRGPMTQSVTSQYETSKCRSELVILPLVARRQHWPASSILIDAPESQCAVTWPGLRSRELIVITQSYHYRPSITYPHNPSPIFPFAANFTSLSLSPIAILNMCQTLKNSYLTFLLLARYVPNVA